MPVQPSQWKLRKRRRRKETAWECNVRSTEPHHRISLVSGPVIISSVLDFNVPSTEPHHRVTRPATASDESHLSRDGRSELFYTSPKPHSSLYHKFVLFTVTTCRAQELCESRGGRPGLPSLISLQFLWT